MGKKQRYSKTVQKAKLTPATAKDLYFELINPHAKELYDLYTEVGDYTISDQYGDLLIQLKITANPVAVDKK